MDRKKIALLTVGHLCLDLNGGALPASLPYIRAARNLDYQETGGLMLAYSCLASLIQPLFGYLSDKHSKPWFIPVGVLLAGCGIAFMGFMTNYWAIFAGIAISGIGSAFFHPEGARFANRASGKSKGAGLSLFSIGGNSGFIFGPLLVTVFVGGFGLHGMTVFAIIGIVMASILFWRISAMPPLSDPTVSDKKFLKEAENSAADPLAAESAQLDETGNRVGAKNNWREFSKLVVVIVGRSMVFVGCNTFIPLYWVNVFHQSKSAGAIAIAILGSCGICFNLIGGMLADRLGYVTMIRCAFFVMAPTVLAFGLVENIAYAYCLLPLLGLSLYLAFSSQVVLGQKLLAKNMGFASGVTLGLATTIGGMTQPLLGWLADSHGLHGVFICLAAVAGTGALFACLLSRKKDDAKA